MYFSIDKNDDDGKRIRRLICRRLCHFNDTSIACLTNILAAKLQTEFHENKDSKRKKKKKINHAQMKRKRTLLNRIKENEKEKEEVRANEKER